MSKLHCPVKPKWVRRLGAFAFLFFLIKGLLWLAIPAGIAAVAVTSSQPAEVNHAE